MVSNLAVLGSTFVTLFLCVQFHSAFERTEPIKSLLKWRRLLENVNILVCSVVYWHDPDAILH